MIENDENISKHSTINVGGSNTSSVAVVSMNSAAHRVLISDTCLKHSILDSVNITKSYKCVI